MGKEIDELSDSVAENNTMEQANQNQPTTAAPAVPAAHSSRTAPVGAPSPARSARPIDLEVSGEYYPGQAVFNISESALGGTFQRQIRLDVCTGIQIVRDVTAAPRAAQEVNVGGRIQRYRGRTEKGYTETGEPYISLIGRFRKGETIRLNGFGPDEDVLRSIADNEEVLSLNVIGQPMYSRAARAAALRVGNAAVQQQLEGQYSLRVEMLEVKYKDGTSEIVSTIPNATRIK